MMSVRAHRLHATLRFLPDPVTYAWSRPAVQRRFMADRVSGTLEFRANPLQSTIGQSWAELLSHESRGSTKLLSSCEAGVDRRRFYWRAFPSATAGRGLHLPQSDALARGDEKGSKAGRKSEYLEPEDCERGESATRSAIGGLRQSAPACVDRQPSQGVNSSVRWSATNRPAVPSFC